MQKDGEDSGITCTVNDDGSYEYEGTATSKTINVWFLGGYNKEEVLFSLDPGTYYIDGVHLFYKNTEIANISDKNIFTFTETQHITGVRAIGATVNETYNKIVYPIVALSNKEVNWERYGTMPSPDFPSEIKAAIKNVNLLDIDKTTYDSTINLQKEGKYLKGTNVDLIRIGTLNNSTPQVGEQLKSGNYTISYEVEANANVTIQNLFLCVIYEDDTQENIGSGKSYSLEKDIKKKVFWTINVKKNVKKTGIASYLSNSCDVILSDIKLEKGKIVTPYTQYHQGVVEAKVVNKNILPFDIKTAEWDEAKISIANNDLTITPNSNGACASVLNGNSLDLSVKKGETITASWKYKKGDLNVNDGGAFGIAIKLKYADGTEGEIKPADITKTNQQSSSSATITLEKDVKNVFIYAYPWNISGTTGSSTYMLQVEKNSSATDSVEHQEQVIIMPVQQEMLDGDYFDCENEKEVHIWDKIENYNDETITSEYISTTGQLTTGATVYYKLETPTKLDFTDEQKAVAKQIKETLHTYKNVTHIYSDDEVSPIVSIEYAKDLNTVISNIQEK